MELVNVIMLLKKKLEDLRKDASIRDFDGGGFRAWTQGVEAILIRGIGDPSTRLLEQFRKATRGLPMPDSIIDPGDRRVMYKRRFESKLLEVEAVLKSIVWELEAFGLPDAHVEAGIRQERTKVFIAHGGQTARLKKLCDFLRALRVDPVVAEWSASEGCWTEEDVDKRMGDADCDIVLAEYGGIVDVKTGAKHPRLNVVDELARSREKRPSRTILLLEKGVDLPSNVKGIVYEHFTKQNMEKAFIKVAKELVAFGIIKAAKP